MSKNLLNVRAYNNKELLLFPASVGDYLPKGHLAHVVDEAVEELDLNCLYKKIAPVGNQAYHPALMVKIWFYGYATRTYSSRKIEEKLNTDVAFIYLAGMQKPDFRTISDFRKNNIEQLKELFIKIVQLCHRLGMIKLGEIALDSKVMKANASIDRTYTEKELIKEQEVIKQAIKEYLERSSQVDEQEDEIYGLDKRGNELPKDIQDKQERIKKMKEILKQLEQAQNKLKESGKEKINLTDEDARIQKTKSGKFSGYRCQTVVDSKEQVIIANDVTNEQNDIGQLIPMVDKALENIREIEPDRLCSNSPQEKIKLLADSGYGSVKNLNEIEKEQYADKIESYIPDPNNEHTDKYHKQDSKFHKSKFIYNRQDDSFICPCKNRLYRRTRTIMAGTIYLLYSNFKACKCCKYFKECSISKDGRTIFVSQYQDIINRMRQKLSSEAGKNIYARRKVIVEPVFGNMSYNLGFKEFLLRKRKVKGEFSLMCIAHNLIKILKKTTKMGATVKEALTIRNLAPITSGP